jgi:hypothetical protein
VNVILTRRKAFILLVVLVFFANLPFFFLSSKIVNQGLNNSVEKLPYTIKSANNDTTAPIITFVRPDINDTSIRTRFYEFIVNITDANPPLPGKVSIEISNSNTTFFSALMNFDQGDLWFFSWDNLTLYPNEEIYIIRVRATDSSSNENNGLSNDLLIFVNVYDARVPDALNAIFYIIAVIVIISLLMVYLNKKRSFFKELNE